MKVIISSFLSVLGIVSAAQAASTGANRPGGWDWEIVEHSGPGCPANKTVLKDINKNNEALNVDNIFFQVFTFPDLRVDAGPNFTKSGNIPYCDVTAKYTERPAPNSSNTSADYRVGIIPNGTYTRAGYYLDGAITARWEFVYHLPGGSSSYHEDMNFEGPLNNDQLAGNQSVISRVTDSTGYSFPLSNCGSNTFQYRIYLYLIPHTTESKGTVDYYRELTNETVGIQHGFSFDWKPCNK